MKTQEVADKAGCKIRIVQRWAGKNNVEYEIKNMKVEYNFTDEQVQKFIERDKNRGRRWPLKE